MIFSLLNRKLNIFCKISLNFTINFFLSKTFLNGKQTLKKKYMNFNTYVYSRKLVQESNKRMETCIMISFRFPDNAFLWFIISYSIYLITMDQDNVFFDEGQGIGNSKQSSDGVHQLFKLIGFCRHFM